MRERLVDSVKRHEGFRSSAYQDTRGYWTVGYGTNLHAVTVSETMARRWMLERLEQIEGQLINVEGFVACSEVRQDVLVEMAYQLGVAGCLRFQRMWTAIRGGDFWAAASEMLDSRWATQTPNRAEVLAGRMRSGKWEPEPERGQDERE